MRIHCDQLQNSDSSRIVVESRISPIVDIELDDLENGSREMVQVRVLKGDKYVNFWVRAWIDNHNKVKCEVSTNLSDKTVKKNITAGSWRNRK